MVEIIGSKSVQPGIFDRFHTSRPSIKDGNSATNNVDLFNRTGNQRNAAVTSRRSGHPSPLNLLPQDDSFYLSTQDAFSPLLREHKGSLSLGPITDEQWKEHQAIKQVNNVDQLNTYAGELATEMRIYCQNRLENIQENVNAIIKRLKEVKPKKKPIKKGAQKSKKVDEKGQVDVDNTDTAVDKNKDLLAGDKVSEKQDEATNKEVASDNYTEIPNDPSGNISQVELVEDKKDEDEKGSEHIDEEIAEEIAQRPATELQDDIVDELD